MRHPPRVRAAGVAGDIQLHQGEDANGRQPVDLNTLVDAGGCVDAFGEKRKLTSAEGINDKCMIVATAEANVGGNARQFAFILKPVAP